MKLYISGPISGKTNYNRVAFLRAESVLKKKGIEVVNPLREAVKALGVAATYAEYMLYDLQLLADPTIDGIVFLEDFIASPGAQIEFIFGKRKRMLMFCMVGEEMHGLAASIEITYKPLSAWK